MIHELIQQDFMWIGKMTGSLNLAADSLQEMCRNIPVLFKLYNNCKCHGLHVHLPTLIDQSSLHSLIGQINRVALLFRLPSPTIQSSTSTGFLSTSYSVQHYVQLPSDQAWWSLQLRSCWCYLNKHLVLVAHYGCLFSLLLSSKLFAYSLAPNNDHFLWWVLISL